PYRTGTTERQFRVHLCRNRTGHDHGDGRNGDGIRRFVGALLRSPFQPGWFGPKSVTARPPVQPLAEPSAERRSVWFSFSRSLAMDSLESSNTIGALAQREFEDLLKHGRAVVVAALVCVIAASWFYVLAGAGTGMSAFEMSSLSMAIGQAM